MNKRHEECKIEQAEITFEVYQNEFEENDLEYVTEKHQPYFEFELKGEKFLIGLDKILECLVIAEKIGELPSLGNGFWNQVIENFGVNFYDYDIKLSQE